MFKRVRAAATLVAAVAVLIVGPRAAEAAAPASGTLSSTTTVLNYTAGPFTQANTTPVPMVDSGPRCNATTFPCDSYALTITLPVGYVAAHNNPAAKVTLSWVDTATGASDYDLDIFKGAVPTTNGSVTADYSSASSANPEIATIFPLVEGTSTYTVKLVPYTPSGETLNVKIQLLDGVVGSSGSGGGSGGTGANGGCGVSPVFGGPDPVVAGCPRYQILTPPTGVAEVSSGEFNIGFNPKTGRIMTMNSGPIYRLSPPEIAKPGAPEVCDSLWEDKSATVTDTGLDPILWTDQKTGRTFASNSTVGANAVYAYTDNDGDFWTPVGAGPPNGGADHETIATGPYPATGVGSTFSNATLNQGQATYYCSQDVVGPASCQRSDSLGSTYGPGVFAYTGTTTECGGLHGHMRVGPDGTAYLPVNQCNGKQGGASTVDAGTTYSEFIITGKNPAALGGNTFTATSQANGADPSVAIDAANRVYYCYVNNEANGTEGHVHVAVSEDGGKTWIRDVDVGKAHGIINAAETEAWGGSAGRAACGFMGSNVAGNYQAAVYKGVWYVFVAHTYDGGNTWVTTNTTPNDPVQGQGGVWQQGGSGDVNGNRNLLDFDEVTADDKGRVLFGFSDGCVTPGCISNPANNDFVANLRVARQIGGKSLFASYDAMTDSTTAKVAHASCLAGTRDTSGSSLTWKVPDSGGAAITSYQIYRSTASGGETLVGQTPDAKPVFKDTTADPSVPDYFYVIRGINSVGTGLTSNEVDLPLGAAAVAENVCTLPGLTELTDAAGDDTGAGAPPGVDLLKASLSQPYAADGAIKLSFTILTNAGTAVLPPNSAWYVAMKVKNANGTFRYTGVHMVPSTTGAPVFETYTPAAGQSGTVDGRFVTSGSTKAADSSSSYDAPNGKIVIVATIANLGLAVNDQIVGFLSGTSEFAGASQVGGATQLYDMMPDSLAFTASYTVSSNQYCRPNTAPMASLSATPVTGTYSYTVTFTAAGTDADTAAPADTIQTYQMDYGDGTSSQPQSATTASPPSSLFTHTYTNTTTDRMVYTAKLTVTDSRGLSSVNSAFVNIEVLPVAATTGGGSSGGSSGGASSGGSSGGASSGGSSGGGSSGGSSGGASSGGASSGGSSGGASSGGSSGGASSGGSSGGASSGGSSGGASSGGSSGGASSGGSSGGASSGGSSGGASSGGSSGGASSGGSSGGASSGGSSGGASSGGSSGGASSGGSSGGASSGGSTGGAGGGGSTGGSTGGTSTGSAGGGTTSSGTTGGSTGSGSNTSNSSRLGGAITPALMIPLLALSALRRRRRRPSSKV